MIQNQSDHLSNSVARPIRVFVLMLLLVFTIEGAIMLGLPLLPDWARRPIAMDVLDASLLTLALAPAVWILVVLPMRRLLEARGQLLHQLFHVQEQERARIARDLHDEIGQHLTALLVGLKTIESAERLELAKERADELRELTARTHKEVGRLARGLRPGVLEELRLEAAIERVCEDFQAAHHIPVQLKISSAACEGLSSEIEISLYRIVQEALTNAARHAKASAIEVSLLRHDNTIRLQVADRGQGFHPDDATDEARFAGKIGLASIRERASMLGGEFTIHSQRGGGTTLQVAVPIAGPHDGKDSRLHRG
jgi:signal transduction histidine kinase